MSHFNPEFNDFMARIQQRIETAEQTYGDRSLHDTTIHLLSELEEEVLDIAGWGFFLWKRMQVMRDKFKRIGVV